MWATTTVAQRVATAQGELQVQQWVPAQAPAAPAIVMQHDSLGCIALWRDFPQRLASLSGRRVIAYDRLGFGRSSPHPGHLTRDYVTQEAQVYVPQVLAAVGVGAYVALGHSIGGCMSIASAAQQPACQGLITIAAQAYVDARIVAGIRTVRAEFQDPAQFARLEKYHGASAGWVLDSWADTWTDPGFADWSLRAVLPQVTCPALVLHGDRDEYGALTQPQCIAGSVSGPASLRILTDCGHIPHREKPDVLLAEILAWLPTTAR